MVWVREFHSSVWHAVSSRDESVTRCGRDVSEFLYEKEFLHDERRCAKCEARQV